MLPPGIVVVCTLAAEVVLPVAASVATNGGFVENVTVPVGAVLPLVAVTVAASVIELPYVPLFGVAVAAVVLGLFSVSNTL